MFCIKCGNQFEGNFCDNCGAPKQGSPAAAPVASAGYSQPAYNTANLFENVSGKIKAMAKLMGATLFIVFLVLGIVNLVLAKGCTSVIISGIIYLVLAPAVSLTNLFAIYGLGILVENSNRMKELAEKKEEK